MQRYMVVFPSEAIDTWTGKRAQIWGVVGHVCTRSNKHEHHGKAAWDVDPPLFLEFEVFGRRFAFWHTANLLPQALQQQTQGVAAMHT